MKKLAFVTPWPPQKTGIADYCYTLVKRLFELKNLSITVFTEANEPMLLDGIQIQHVSDVSAINLESYDLVIYHMGNNPYHIFVKYLLDHYGGIVHLHDMVNHHLYAGYFLEKINAPWLYYQLLTRWYGATISRLTKQLFNQGVGLWDTDLVTLIPLFEESLEHASACIVHSKFAKNNIQNIFNKMPVYQHSLLMNNANIKLIEKHYTHGQTIKFAVFGEVIPNKKVALIIDTFLEINKKALNWELHIVGEINPHYHALRDNITNLIENPNFKNKIILHGRVQEKEFFHQLSQMDVCINLRYPTMGETSAVAINALQMGIPLIVTDIGWYKELPEFADKLPPATMSKSLQEFVLQYLLTPELLNDKKKHALEYAKSLSYDTMVEEYYNTLLKEYNKNKISRLVTQ